MSRADRPIILTGNKVDLPYMWWHGKKKYLCCNRSISGSPPCIWWQPADNYLCHHRIDLGNRCPAYGGTWISKEAPLLVRNLLRNFGKKICHGNSPGVDHLGTDLGFGKYSRDMCAITFDITVTKKNI